MSIRRGIADPAKGILLCVVVALAVLLATAAAAAADSSLRVAQGGGATFPSRSLVLAVPSGMAVQPSQVHVSENGRRISEPVVRPIANAAAGDFGVVLAIDVGPSMRGAPLARAMEAARALAAQRTGNQELGVVAFDEAARISLPLTADPQAIERALAHTPRVGHGAYIYNAMTLAVQQLANAKIAAGAVILLSDGASQGAQARPGHQVTANSIGAAATAAHVQIYTVGLRDNSYTPARMSLLARVGGGEFIESTSSRLAEVFRQIEAGLTSAYVVRYRSAAPGGHSVEVSVTVDGVPGAATLSYTAPGSPASLPVKHQRKRPFWSSTSALVVASLVAALVIGFGLFVLVAPRLFRERLRRRVGEFTAGGISDPAEMREALHPLRFAGVERLLERTAWWPRFKEEVAIARLHRTPVELAAITLAATAAVAVLLGTAFGTPVVSVIVLLLGPYALHSFVAYKVKRQRDLFSEQLPAHLQEVASAMRAGHSLVSGITSMAREAPEPSRSEWKLVIADEQLGVSLEEAMQPMAARMDSDDVKQVALVAALHHRTGGNMAEVLERVADSVRERAELRRELRALTAQARLSRYIVTALPPFVACAITLIDPPYLRPLFHTTAGIVLVFISLAMLVLASRIMRTITNVEA